VLRLLSHYLTTILSWSREPARQYASCVRPATYDQVLKAVARNVRTARSRLAISQEEAADRAGMAPRQWQRVEAGLGVTLKTLTAVAAALRAELSELVQR
jgi:DNA-binding Xre family transcriptional regulator